MKILHTSDWHVGKQLRGRSRAAEHEAALAEIVGIARAEKVDLVLVVGDLFESAAPPPEAERIVWRALLDLAATGADVVVLSGNHDSERRLQAVEPLLGLGRIITRASFKSAADGGVVTGRTRSGEDWRVACVPFLSQRFVVKADELMDAERGAADHAQHYDGRVTRIVDALCGGFDASAVNIVAAHLFVAGGTLGGGERTAHVFGDYAVSAAAFPPSAHYVALGHLHRAQRIPAGPPVWYSGSPIQLDFGETNDQKGVLVVDVTATSPAQVKAVALRSGRKLRTVSGSLADLELLDWQAGDDYLRIVLKEVPRPGLADEVRSRFPNAIDVVIAAPDGTERRRAGGDRTGRAPQDLFAEYLREHHVEDAALTRLFNDLVERAIRDEAEVAP